MCFYGSQKKSHNFLYSINLSIFITETECVYCAVRPESLIKYNIYGSVYRNNILVYNSNKMHKSQSLFNPTTVLHVSGVTVTHRQEHKTTVTTASGNRYTVLLSAAIVEELEHTFTSVPTLPR